ncbi:MAG TPA: hypothetical protein VJ919_02775 [Tangfeifania sp.]|nr:hypothetical protein [Tangfeifania sp.]
MILVLASAMSMAQQRDFDPEEFAKRQTAQLKEELDLNKEQEEKVYDLNLESIKKMSKLREEMQSGGGFEGMREKMTEIREEQNKKMKEILSEKQWTKYEKFQEERRGRMRDRRRP